MFSKNYFHAIKRQGSQSRLWAFLLIVLVLLLFMSCGPQKIVLRQLPSLPNVIETPIHWETPAAAVEGVKLSLPGDVLNVKYDRESNLVAVKYRGRLGTKKTSPEGNIIVYDLNNHHVNWAKSSNSYIEVLLNGVCILRYGYDRKVLNAYTCQILRDAEPNLIILPDGTTLSISSEEFSCIDLTSGTKIWRREGNKWKGFLYWKEWEDWLYLVADGIHAFRVDNGMGWDFITSTSHAAVGKAIAKDAALTVLSALLGGFYSGMFHAPVTHNVCSVPLIYNDNLYFAARKNVFCFDRQTGEIEWQKELNDELGSMFFFEAGSNVVLVGCGWKYVNFAIKKAAIPAVYVFEKDSGEQVAQVELEKEIVVLDGYGTDKDIFLLAPGNLYSLDQKLNIQGVRNVKPEEGEFLRFLPSEDQIVIRSANGVTALSPLSLDTLWEKQLFASPMTQLDRTIWEGAQVLYNRTNELNHSWKSKNLHWLANSKNFVAIDLKKNGETIFEFPIDTDIYFITQNGDLISRKENSLTIISLKNIE